MLEQMKLDLDTLCGKTSPEPSAQTAAKTSARCSKKSAESSTKEPMFLDLTRGGTLWRTSGAIMGDGYSVAWRVLDAQFWGVPQRRRRIALVADFGGSTAPEILFVSNSLSGRTQAGRTTRQGTPSDIEGGTGTTIGFNYRMGSKAGSVGAATEQSGTLKAGCNDHAVCKADRIQSYEQHHGEDEPNGRQSGNTSSFRWRRGGGMYSTFRYRSRSV